MTRDLTPEGQMLLDSILKYTMVVETLPPPIPPVQGKGKWQVECDRMKIEIMKIIVNSLMVIEDCDEIISQLTTAEGYINCDAKVAKTLHHNNIERLQRVLKGMTAFNEDRDEDLMRNLSHYLAKVKIQ